MWVLSILFLLASSQVEEPFPTAICVPCQPGTHSTVICATQINGVNCSSGYCEIHSNCSECEPGFAQPLDRQSECEPCGPGYWGDEPGAPNCLFCLRGYFCPHSNNTEMTPCPIGHFCPGNRMMAPTLCPGGSYCPAEELKNPVICPAGKFCVEGCISPTDCPPDTRCPPGSSVPNPCPPLFHSDGRSDACYPDAGFWSIIGVASVVVTAICVYVFIRKNITKPAHDPELPTEDTQTDKEAYGLIPKSKGPSYSGL